MFSVGEGAGMLKRCLTWVIAVVFSTVNSLPSLAQVMTLPEPALIVGLSTAFKPCVLRGIKLDSNNPLRFDFVVDQGDSGLQGVELEEESQHLVKYFLAALTTPETDLWVNLSPYESDRIVDDNFGRTEMGRDLLAVDYFLKQITSSLMHPDSSLGKKFWSEVYQKAYEKYGTTDIPVDTFNKVWIVPQHAVVYENRAEPGKSLAAYVDEAKLKVMLDTDYFASAQAAGEGVKPSLAMKEARTRPEVEGVIRDIIVPVLEKEVNEGRNFSQLRQVYHSLLLAVWLKKKLRSALAVRTDDGKIKGNILSMIFLDHKKTGGIETADPRGEIDGIYGRYVEAFKKGVYNLIREDFDTYSQELIPRKYFSGGVVFDSAEVTTRFLPGLRTMLLLGTTVVAMILSSVSVSGNEVPVKGAHFRGATLAQSVKSKRANPVRIDSPASVERNGVNCAIRFVGIHREVFKEPGIRPGRVFDRNHMGISPEKFYQVLYELYPEEGDIVPGETREARARRERFLGGFRAIGWSREKIMNELFAWAGKESGMGVNEIQKGGLGLGPLQFDGDHNYTGAYRAASRLGIDLPDGADQLEFALLDENSDVYYKVALVKMSMDVQRCWNRTMRFMGDTDFRNKLNGWFPGADDKTLETIVFDILHYMAWNAGVGHSDKLYQDSMEAMAEYDFDVRLLHKELIAASGKFDARYLKVLRAYNATWVLHVLEGGVSGAEGVAASNGEALSVTINTASLNVRPAVLKRNADVPQASGSAPGGLSGYESEVWSRVSSDDKRTFGIEEMNSPRTLAIMRMVSQRLPQLSGKTPEGKGIGLIHYAAVAHTRPGTPVGANIQALLDVVNSLDKAQTQDVGGIDLNPARLDMDFKGDGGVDGLQYEFTPEQVRMMDQDVPGFVPVVINVTPVGNVAEFLGFK